MMSSTLSQREQDEMDDETTMPVAIALCMTLGWMMMCSGIFLLWEKEWTYFNSFYFFFISLSTIGLGDVTPEQPKMLILAFAFVIIGLSLVSMTINVIQIKIEEWLFHVQQMIKEEYERAMAMGDCPEKDEILARIMNKQPWFMRNVMSNLITESQAEQLEHNVEQAMQEVVKLTSNTRGTQTLDAKVPPPPREDTRDTASQIETMTVDSDVSTAPSPDWLMDKSILHVPDMMDKFTQADEHKGIIQRMVLTQTTRPRFNEIPQQTSGVKSENLAVQVYIPLSTEEQAMQTSLTELHTVPQQTTDSLILMTDEISETIPIIFHQIGLQTNVIPTETVNIQTSPIGTNESIMQTSDPHLNSTSLQTSIHRCNLEDSEMQTSFTNDNDSSQQQQQQQQPPRPETSNAALQTSNPELGNMQTSTTSSLFQPDDELVPRPSSLAAADVESRGNSPIQIPPINVVLTDSAGTQTTPSSIATNGLVENREQHSMQTSTSSLLLTRQSAIDKSPSPAPASMEDNWTQTARDVVVINLADSLNNKDRQQEANQISDNNSEESNGGSSVHDKNKNNGTYGTRKGRNHRQQLDSQDILTSASSQTDPYSSSDTPSSDVDVQTDESYLKIARKLEALKMGRTKSLAVMTVPAIPGKNGRPGVPRTAANNSRAGGGPNNSRSSAVTPAASTPSTTPSTTRPSLRFQQQKNRPPSIPENDSGNGSAGTS